MAAGVGRLTLGYVRLGPIFSGARITDPFRQTLGLTAGDVAHIIGVHERTVRGVGGRCGKVRSEALANTTSKSIYRGHRFPAGVIEQAVWLYFRFPLSLRMVEDLLAVGKKSPT